MKSKTGFLGSILVTCFLLLAPHGAVRSEEQKPSPEEIKRMQELTKKLPHMIDNAITHIETVQHTATLDAPQALLEWSEWLHDTGVSEGCTKIAATVKTIGEVLREDTMAFPGDARLVTYLIAWANDLSGAADAQLKYCQTGAEADEQTVKQYLRDAALQKKALLDYGASLKPQQGT